MAPADWISLGALAVVVLGQIVWVVIALTKLGSRMDTLGAILERIEKRQEDHEARLRALEAAKP